MNVKLYSNKNFGCNKCTYLLWEINNGIRNWKIKLESLSSWLKPDAETII